MLEDSFSGEMFLRGGQDQAQRLTDTLERTLMFYKGRNQQGVYSGHFVYVGNSCYKLKSPQAKSRLRHWISEGLLREGVIKRQAGETEI